MTPELAGLKRAGPKDAKQVADITAEAFSEDPVNLWVFGSPRALRAGFGVMSRIYAKAGACYLSGDQGAAMWLLPGQHLPFGTLEMLRFTVAMILSGQAGAGQRGAMLSEQMQEHHPTDPHYYLFTIGTRQSARGKGIGHSLIAPMLAEADRQDLPVYLENSNPANHGFYVAHGFEKTGEFLVGGDGPPMAPMWREPRAPS